MSKHRKIFARFVVEARDEEDIIGLSHEAFRLWWSAILWCRHKGNDGFLPESMLLSVAPPVKNAPRAKDELVRAGFLLADQCDGRPGWTIRKYTDYQDTKAIIDARKASSVAANIAQGKMPVGDVEW